MPLLKVKLMSIKAPKLTPVQEIKQKHIPAPVIKTKKITTENKAEKIVPKKKITPTPVSKKIEKVAPIKQEVITEPVKVTPVIEKSTTKKIVKNNKKQNIPATNSIAFSTRNTLSSSTVIKETKYRKQIPPVYPRRALELGQQGNVILHAFIKPDGLPSELKIKDSSGHSLLDKAALAAVRKWEFEPIHKDGITIASWVRVPIEFVIQ